MSRSKGTVGVVKRVVQDRGFGFIRTPEGEEYFFHHSELVPPLAFGPHLQGMSVAFIPSEGPRGPRASAVAQA